MASVGQAVGEFLPMAVGVAISPVPIIAIILMLFSTRAGANSAMFLLGWVVGITAVATIVLIVAETQNLTSSSGQPASGVSWIKLVIGLLLLGLARRNWQKRPAPGEAAALPKWLQAIDSVTPGKALGLGLLLSAVNPKNLILTLAGALSIAQADLSTTDDVIAVAVFVVIAASTVAAPVVLYQVLGERAQSTLDAMKVWLSVNNATVMSVLLLIFGVVLIGKAIGPLTS
jgi:threonine/homoserine/homoserine lactone efflux protein